MKVRRPLKYVLIVAGLAAGWAAGGALQGRGESHDPPPRVRPEPRTRPTAGPATRPTSGPLSPVPRGEG